MTPHIFTNNDSSRNLSDKMTLRFTGQSIFPSKALAAFLDLEDGSYVTFMVDVDKPRNVYIRNAELDEEWTAKVGIRDEKTMQLRMYALPVVKHVLNLTRAYTSVTLYVSPKPTKVNGKIYYRIITEQPYAIK